MPDTRLKLNGFVKTGAPGDPPPKAFEILAITAGVGNGWKFSREVLKASVPLWDGLECFVDHAPAGHSVRDLCGTFSEPAFDSQSGGILLKLTPAGPAASVLLDTGAQILAGTLTARIGFSADLSITVTPDKEVTSINKVHSVDLVHNPARGGRFIRSLNQKGYPTMPEEEPTLEALAEAQASAQAQLEEAKQVRLSMCALLLDTTLTASNLPQAIQADIRRQFENQVFEPEKLTAAVENGRKLVTELTASQTVTGLSAGRVSGMYDTRDKLQAAVDDLLGAPRDPGSETLKTPRLQGIRELYMTLTGDYDLHGGYFGDRVQLATTADFTGLVKNALNKLVVEHWAELGRAGYTWWEKIASVEHFNSLNQITGTIVGTVGTLPSVAEGAEYTELPVGDSSETADFVKYGGYIPLTLELIDRDQTHKLRAYPRELANAGLRKISSLVAAIFTANSGVGPTMADGGALFNSTAVTTAGGHANLRTTALSANEWDAVCTAVYNQPMLIKNAAGVTGTGPKMAINPRYLLVPRALQLTAMKILYPSLENAASIYSENQQRGQPGDVVTVPEWSDATDWAAVCDPRLAPAVFIGERFGIKPEIFIAGDETSPAVFMNDEHRLKVRHFLAVWVNDYRPLHKSNVAG